MALTVAERKHRMPHGGQHRLAKRFGVTDSYLSAVMAGECHPKSKRTKLRLRRMQLAIAAELGLSLDDVFSPEEQAQASQQPVAA